MAPNMTKQHLQINAMREDMAVHIPPQIEPEWIQLPDVLINNFDHWIQLLHAGWPLHANEVLDDIFNSFIEDWDLWMEEMDNISD